MGDDFYCTNPARIRERKGAANALLWKFNQIGTLSEALDAPSSPTGRASEIMVSERSARPETPSSRTCGGHQRRPDKDRRGRPAANGPAKYNRLLLIEEEPVPRPATPAWTTTAHYRCEDKGNGSSTRLQRIPPSNGRAAADGQRSADNVAAALPDFIMTHGGTYSAAHQEPG